VIREILLETTKIVAIVALLMTAVEWFQIRFKGEIERFLTKSFKTQIIGSSLLGVLPGCIDAFLIVSLYSHGLVGFRALVAVMLSTAGDEAFVMLAMIPKTAILIFSICAAFGIIGGFMAEIIAGRLNLKREKPCSIEVHGGKLNRGHFFREHLYRHIFRTHIPRLFLWIFFTLLIIHFLMVRLDLARVLPQNKLLLILLAAVVGVIPESGPHLLFLTLYTRGLIPFSVLLVSSLSQDGHGLLPLLSYSLHDTIKVQIFTTLFALGVGLVLFLVGI
jgi:hypothetical protein